MRTAALIAAIVLATPAWTHTRLDISPDYDPKILWLDAPRTTAPGQARMRLVYHGQEAIAALTPDQYWHYSKSYRRALARLSLRMPVYHAEPRARHAAFRDVLSRYPNLNVQGLDTDNVDGGRLVGGILD